MRVLISGCDAQAGSRAEDRGEPEHRRQLAQVSLIDVSFAAALNTSHIAAGPVDCNSGVNVAAIGLAARDRAPYSSSRAPLRESAAW